jgi:hypothetical protein
MASHDHRVPGIYFALAISLLLLFRKPALLTRTLHTHHRTRLASHALTLVCLVRSRNREFLIKTFQDEANSPAASQLSRKNSVMEEDDMDNLDAFAFWLLSDNFRRSASNVRLSRTLTHAVAAIPPGCPRSLANYGATGEQLARGASSSSRLCDGLVH